MAVRTGKVAGRRNVEFTCYQDILDDVHALATGRLQSLICYNSGAFPTGDAGWL